MTEAAKTTKINGVYCVSNAIGGGMKNSERTKKERDALCGECVSYDLGKPQPWEIVSAWPEDIRREYLKKLYWDYGGSWCEIGDVLGVTRRRVEQLFNEFSLPRRGRGPKSAADKVMWEAFLSGKSRVKDLLPKETAEKLNALVISADTKEEVIQDKRPIARIRSAVMNDLSAMSDVEFAEFAEDLSYGVDHGQFSNLQSKKELNEDHKCVSCKRIFGKCIIAEAHNFGCPFNFTEWALADGSRESDYELLQRFVTRIIKEKADE